MTTDYIVQEIHDIREQLAKECDYNIHKIFARARATQAARGISPVSPNNAEIAKQVAAFKAVLPVICSPEELLSHDEND